MPKLELPKDDDSPETSTAAELILWLVLVLVIGIIWAYGRPIVAWIWAGDAGSKSSYSMVEQPGSSLVSNSPRRSFKSAPSYDYLWRVYQHPDCPHIFNLQETGTYKSVQNYLKGRLSLEDAHRCEDILNARRKLQRTVFRIATLIFDSDLANPAILDRIPLNCNDPSRDELRRNRELLLAVLPLDIETMELKCGFGWSTPMQWLSALVGVAKAECGFTLRVFKEAIQKEYAGEHRTQPLGINSWTKYRGTETETDDFIPLQPEPIVSMDYFDRLLPISGIEYNALRSEDLADLFDPLDLTSTNASGHIGRHPKKTLPEYLDSVAGKTDHSRVAAGMV